jgi:hypothetical protein
VLSWRTSRRRIGLAVAATLLGAATLMTVVGAVPAGPAPEALAQSGQDCYELRRVIVGEDENGNPMYGWRVVNVCESEGGGGDEGGGGPNTCTHPTYGEFPCHDPGRGWWSSSENCYVSLVSPQPPAGDPGWEGNEPGEGGAVYVFHCPVGQSGSGMFTRETGFLAQGPDLPSVAELAQQAMDSLPLVGAEIGIAPEPEGVGLVGLNVWMWTENTDATWGPVSVSVPGPGITVTAQGQVTQIEWNMGDGTTVVCDEPGTPYDESYGDEPSPDCGHVYTEPSRDQPDGRYTITAETTWHLEWWVEPRGSGVEDEDFESRESSTSVQINELQVVTS